ncbi:MULTISPECIES: hypothetical protein [Pseudomonas syringae group]|uniref:Uncharacterized protein n=1 Tax=Pseudomonas serbiensis TaxID=3064350 RepID=A0ABT9CWU8_9PSED|nr:MULTISPECIES: hypothetical protein [Pseudomonas]MDO7929982.1 hypothetical protein [Pseudomonas sp. KFB-138]
MNEAIIFTSFTLLTLIAYLISLWASLFFSGNDYSPIKSWILAVYNTVIIFIHMSFIKLSTLPFVGKQDNSIFGWLSFVMLFAHAFTHITPFVHRIRIVRK